MRGHRSDVVFALVFAISSSSWAIAEEHLSGNFITIQPPDADGTITYPFDINDRGDIVGAYNSGNHRYGFLRSADGTFTRVNFPGSFRTHADAISTLGDIVGWYARVQGEFHGFRRSRDGQYTSIDFPGAKATKAVGIDREGDIVGFYCTATASCPPDVSQPNNAHGFLLRDGQFTSIDFPDAVETYAFKINSESWILGKYVSADGRSHLFLYGDEFLEIDFPRAVATGVNGANAGVNAHGDIAGDYCSATPCRFDNGTVHGFVLTDDGFATIDVPGAVATSAYGINARGDIVGPYNSDASHTAGFLLPGNQVTTNPRRELSVPRVRPVAIRLLDGKVLVTGGHRGFPGGTVHTSAELFDPVSETFVPAGNMTEPRAYHSATLLQNGDVLILGGIQSWDLGAASSTAEIYLSKSGLFAPTGGMAVKRAWMAATLLQDGTVLVTGGEDGIAIRADAEIYDPRTGRFSTAGFMTEPRAGHVATLLPDGRVLIAGGTQGVSAEIYDPATHSFARTGDLLNRPVTPLGAALPDGKVLILGSDDLNGTATYSQLYDPASGVFTVALPTWSAPWRATVTPLPDGTLLIAGGGHIDDWVWVSDMVALYDPATGSFTRIGALRMPRTEHAAAALADGRVLIMGGIDGSSAYVTSNAEIYVVSKTGRRRSPRR